MRTTSDGTVITQHAHEKYLAYKAKAEDYSRALKQGPGHGKKHKHKSKSETSSSTSTSKSSSTSSTDSTLTSSTSSRKTSKRKHHAKDDMLRLAHANEMRRREEQARWEHEQAMREAQARQQAAMDPRVAPQHWQSQPPADNFAQQGGFDPRMQGQQMPPQYLAQGVPLPDVVQQHAQATARQHAQGVGNRSRRWQVRIKACSEGSGHRMGGKPRFAGGGMNLPDALYAWERSRQP